MSKKLAEGTDALVLDVKTGSGAFMKKEEDAVFLAELMVETGERMGKQMVALITDMNQPLGRTVGNALEVQECIEVLHGGGPTICANSASTSPPGCFFSEARPRPSPRASNSRRRSSPPARPLTDFVRWSSFREAISASSTIRRGFPPPLTASKFPARQAGYVTAIACEQVGTACVILGGGRERKEDSVDPAVGIVIHKKIGDKVSAGESLCTIHCHSDAQAARAKALLKEAIKSQTLRPRTPPR